MSAKARVESTQDVNEIRASADIGYVCCLPDNLFLPLRHLREQHSGSEEWLLAGHLGVGRTHLLGDRI